jgi:hypothetical protein
MDSDDGTVQLGLDVLGFLALSMALFPNRTQSFGNWAYINQSASSPEDGNKVFPKLCVLFGVPDDGQNPQIKQFYIHTICVTYTLHTFYY